MVKKTADNSITDLALPRWTSDLLKNVQTFFSFKSEFGSQNFELSKDIRFSMLAFALKDKLLNDQEIAFNVPHNQIYSSGNNAKLECVVYKKNSAVSVIETMEWNREPDNVISQLDFLANIKSVQPHLRCFLLLVSFKGLPEPFIYSKGKKAETIFNEDNYSFKVKDARKEIINGHGYKKRPMKKIQYACLIEVFNN